MSLHLEINKKYANLKELCEVFNLEYKDSTCSRKALIKEIEQYVKLKKDGRGYYITEIYTTVQEKEDERGTNPNSHLHSTSIYADIDLLLMHYITKQSKKYMYVYNTSKILAKETIFNNNNNNYYYYSNNISTSKVKLSKEHNITINYLLQDVLDNVTNNINSVIKTSLNRLHKNFGLEYSYNYIIQEYQQEIREATAEEVLLIDKVTKEFMLEFNKIRKQTILENIESNNWSSEKKTEVKINFLSKYKPIKTMNDVNYIGANWAKKFYKELNDRITEEFAEQNVCIDTCYKCYIIKTQDFTEQLTDVNINNTISNLIKKFTNNNYKSLQKNISKKKLEIDEEIDKALNKLNVVARTEERRQSIKESKYSRKVLERVSIQYVKEYKLILDVLFK